MSDLIHFAPCIHQDDINVRLLLARQHRLEHGLEIAGGQLRRCRTCVSSHNAISIPHSGNVPAHPHSFDIRILWETLVVGAVAGFQGFEGCALEVGQGAKAFGLVIGDEGVAFNLTKTIIHDLIGDEEAGPWMCHRD